MGGSVADGLQEVAADNDEPPHGAGFYPQKTIVTLSGYQLIRHWRINRSGRRRGTEQPMYYISRALKDAETCYPRAKRERVPSHRVRFTEVASLFLGIRSMADD